VIAVLLAASAAVSSTVSYFFFGDTRFWCFYFFLPAMPGFEHGWLCVERVEARAAPRIKASSLLIQTTVALGLR
jgi:hypothetical protein